MPDNRTESDSVGLLEVAAGKLWGAQTQRSLEHFSIGGGLIAREMISAYATLKPLQSPTTPRKRLDLKRYKLIVQTCAEMWPVSSTRCFRCTSG
jgi:fumarate hydratase, class II